MSSVLKVYEYLVYLLLGWAAAAFIIAGMLAQAALGGILGYCIGCFLYYQYKLLKQKIALKRC